MAPEHDLVDAITTPEQAEAVADYKHQASLKSDLARTDLAKEKTGVWTGAYAINPVNGKEIPIWIADYVLASYGTGAVMAVPAHDERDWEFAKQFGLPIVEVLEGGNVTEAAYTEDGLHVNSDFLNGLNKEEAIAKIVSWLEEKGFGQERLPTVFVTGSLAVNVTGVNQSQSFIGKMGLRQLFQKVNSHLSCQ